MHENVLLGERMMLSGTIFLCNVFALLTHPYLNSHEGLHERMQIHECT